MHRIRLRRLRRHWVWAGALALASGLSGLAHAGPRDDMKTAYELAKSQFNDLELDSAVATLEAAVARAQGEGMAVDPALAPLLVLRGGIIYSNTGDRSRTVAAFQEAVRADFNVTLPIELRSAELQALLDEARAGVPQPSGGAIVHTPVNASPGEDIDVEALSSVALSEGITMVLYWRVVGSEAAFDAVYLDTFGNLGTATISASAHGDQDVEYFFYVYDADQQSLANLGDKDSPMVISLGGSDVNDGTDDDEDGSEDQEPRGGRSSTAFPRTYINLGIGTGIGVARGAAELTYQQFTPGTFGVDYGLAEQACAIERWYAGQRSLAATPAEFGQHLLEVPPAAVPDGDIAGLTMAYNPDRCATRHPVTTGFASAPLHLAPEVSVRVYDTDIGARRSLALLVGAYGRLQVVTGSRVITEDPTASSSASFNQEVLNNDPRGFQRKPPFTWAVGVKLKALISKRGGKLQGMLGAFAGYGTSRLRVDMGFANDRNGNSVPDRNETALSGLADENNQVPINACTPVWPYNNGCTNTAEGMLEQGIARGVQAASPTNENRVDTVRLGPGFAGVLFGVHYQLHKNFGLFGEANIGGWFPDAGSLLIDINIGPSITF